MEGGFAREEIDFDGAEVRPVELGGGFVAGPLRGEDDAGDTAGVEHLAEALLAQAGRAHPEMLKLVTELGGAGVGAGEELRVRGGIFPVPFAAGVGDVGQRGHREPPPARGAILHQRPQMGIGAVTHFLREGLQMLAGRERQARVVAQREGNGGDMDAGLAGDIGLGDSAIHREAGAGESAAFG